MSLELPDPEPLPTFDAIGFLSAVANKLDTDIVATDATKTLVQNYIELAKMAIIKNN